MTPKDNSMAELRARAKTLLRAHGIDRDADEGDDIHRLVCELEVHRVELEMQNQELRQAQEELEASRDRYVDLYDFAPLGYVTLDARGFIRQINLTAVKLLGVERKRLAGRAFATYVEKRHKQLFRRHIQACLDGASPASCEVLLQPNEGEPVPVKLDSVRVEDNDHGPLCRTAITDITQRKRAEDVAKQRATALSHLTAQLGEAEQRERKRLAQILHDDLQQLLLAARMGLAKLRRGGSNEHAVDEVDELLDQCMGMSRELTTELSPPVVGWGTLGDVLRWLAALCNEKHGLDISVDVSEALPATSENQRTFFYQAVRELLMNAAKHAGGQKVRIAAEVEHGMLVVTVEDGGRGFHAKRVEKSLGRNQHFGLFGIHERAERLGGRLEIGNSPTGGARFRLVVPIEQAEPAPFGLRTSGAAEADAQMPGRPRAEVGTLRLLLVDDHKMVRQGLTAMLNSGPGFAVVGQAEDGEEAVRRVEALRPDAVIMDIGMPGLNGIEATREIKRRWPETVVIGLSMHAEEGAVLAMLDAGATGYLCKDSPAEDLIGAIRRLCGRE